MPRFTRPAETFTAVIVVIALTGCTAQSVSRAASQAPIQASSPTPTVMNLKESATTYKAGACRVSSKGQSFNQVWTSGSGDMESLRQAAATARDAMSITATELDKGNRPTELQDDIAVVRDADFAQASILAQIATAPTGIPRCTMPSPHSARRQPPASAFAPDSVCRGHFGMLTYRRVLSPGCSNNSMPPTPKSEVAVESGNVPDVVGLTCSSDLSAEASDLASAITVPRTVRCGRSRRAQWWPEEPIGGKSVLQNRKNRSQ